MLSQKRADYTEALGFCQQPYKRKIIILTVIFITFLGLKRDIVSHCSEIITIRLQQRVCYLVEKQLPYSVCVVSINVFGPSNETFSFVVTLNLSPLKRQASVWTNGVS
jgi:hypothetical protein